MLLIDPALSSLHLRESRTVVWIALAGRNWDARAFIVLEAQSSRTNNSKTQTA